VVAVPVERVRRLRGDTLRPGLPPSASVYPQDELPDTVHLAVVREGKVIGSLTLFPEPYLEQPAWRLRGMATDPEWRGFGCGRALLREATRVMQANEGTVLWCNARTSVVDFYRDSGFEIVGPEFITEAGMPHRVGVWRASPPES
jgi:predicted GNAT family N-acyltransferase